MLELVLMEFMPVWPDLVLELDQKWKLKLLLLMLAAAFCKQNYDLIYSKKLQGIVLLNLQNLYKLE